MRTTVRLDEDLLREARLLAAAERTTLTALLEQALRELLARRKKARSRPRVALPTSEGWGLQSGIDLNRNAALLDLTGESDDVS
jgi:putative antitoxin of VapBC-like toxin-antitoxin system